MNPTTYAEGYNYDVDHYGLSRHKSKPAPKYDWLYLPAGSLRAQKGYLWGLLVEVQRDIHALARKQYSLPREEYNEKLSELYERKRVLLAVFNPYNHDSRTGGHPVMGCTWMRTGAQ